MALHSARLAAQCYLAGSGATEFQSRFTADVAPQVRRATLMSRLLVSGASQALSTKAASLLPGLVGAVARYTRIPAHSVAGARYPLRRREVESAYSTPVRPTGT